MDSKISILSIERLRTLRHLKMEGLGRINLITGRNNCGKSSLLEGLRILASNASPVVISNILHYREEDVEESDETARIPARGSFDIVLSLFSGFPSIDKCAGPIEIVSEGSAGRHRMSLSVERFVEQRDPDGVRRLIPEQQGLFPEAELIPALVVESEGFRRFFRHFGRFARRFYGGDRIGEELFPCVYVSPYASERTSELAALWDDIALSDRETHVVDAMRIISPDIQAVSMVGGEQTRRSRIAIARSNSFRRPVPLRSFGDGVNRLFGVVLSLVNAENGLLLVDEIENGMHHTVQLDLWRAIFHLSRRLNIQVFATTHSWDCVAAFQKAAAEDPEDGVLLRLTRTERETIPTLFREHELAVATRESIEVR